MRKLIIQTFIMICVSLFTAANAQQWGLYTLYAPQNSTSAYLIDTANTPVTYKTWAFATGKKTAYSTYLVPGDTIVRTYSYTVSGGMSGGGVTGGVQKVLWNGTVVWDFQYNSSTYTLHHDICPMANGNVLMIAYELKTSAQATQAGASSSTSIYSEKIMEVSPTGATTGTIVWEWHLWDHLCQVYSSSKDNYVTNGILNNPQLMNINIGSSQDRFHMNGIDYNADLDQIVVSMHMTNEIYVIDHSTTTAQAATHAGGNSGKGGDFLYRWGKPANYGATGTTIFNVVHDAHWVPANNPLYPNYLCAFNNKGGTSNYSAFTICNPPYSGYNYSLTAGQAYLPPSSAYQYSYTASAQDLGNSQQLPNGNSLMCIPAMPGYIIEVNSSGTTLWSKQATSPQAFRYTLCYVRGPVAMAGASATSVYPGTQITLNASAISVTESSPTYTYSWTSIPAGFSSSSQNPTVTPGASTSYIVTITNTAIGCSRSDTVTVDVLTGISKSASDNYITVYPIPTTGIVNLSEDYTVDGNFEVTMYNSYGNILLKANNTKVLDLSAFSNGIYYLTYHSEKINILNIKIILIK
jgi:hypothetical protein